MEGKQMTEHTFPKARLIDWDALEAYLKATEK